MTATPHEIVSLPTRGRHLYRRTQGLLESYFCSRSWGGTSASLRSGQAHSVS